MRLSFLVGAAAALVCLDAGIPAHRIARAKPVPDKPLDKAVVAATATPPAPAPTIVEHAAPSGGKETCQLLARFPFVPNDVTQDPASQTWYRDDDVEDIEKLCAIDLYARRTTPQATAVGVCPKIHWTQPALEIYELDKDHPDKEKFERTRCPKWRHRRGAKKIAKIKPAIYGTEVESPLLYFHLSRLLGHIAFVYPTTWRTVAREELRDAAVDAIAYIDALNRDDERTPLDGWEIAARRYGSRRGAAAVPTAFAKNPRGEISHHPFKYYPDRKKRISRPRDIREQSYWKIVASRKPIADLIELDPSRPRKYREAVQELAYAQDITHMVILDAVLNQRDRAGNINARLLYHSVDDQGRLRWKKDRPKGSAGAKALKLERLLLKDNDDGLKFDSVGRLNSKLLIGEIRHLDPTTYARIQWLANLMRDPATADQVKKYFRTAHISSANYDRVRDRFLDVAADFEKLAAAGKLRLDLGLADAVRGAPASRAQRAARSDHRTR